MVSNPNLEQIQVLNRKYKESMLERESEKHIIIGNSKITSSLAIFNYPKGFGRKDLFTQSILKSENEKIDWCLNEQFQFEILENFYCLSQIRKHKIIKSLKKKIQIILCPPYDVDSWKKCFENHAINHIVYNNEHNFCIEDSETLITILCTSENISRFIKLHFNCCCSYRFIVCDPELYNISPFPRIFFNFCFVLTSDPHVLLTLEKDHFIFKICPFNIDYSIYNSLSIIKDLSIQEQLKDAFVLPDFLLQKHNHRASLHHLLQDCVPEIYDFMEEGSFHCVLEKLNMNSGHNNIYSFLNNQIDSQIEVIDTFLKNVKLNKNTQHRLVAENLEKKEELQIKKKKIIRSISDFSSMNECMICRKNLNNTQIALVSCCYNCCSCCQCLFKWLEENKECPYCRQVIFQDNVYSINPDTIQAPTTTNTNIGMTIQLKTKQNTLLDIIDLNIEKSSIMLYCQHDDFSRTVNKITDQAKIPFIEFRGSFTEKMQLLNRNENTNCVYFITNYKEVIGFKFPKIDHFISYSFLPKTIYKYLCSRFYRIGRKNPFHYHYFNSYTDEKENLSS